MTTISLEIQGYAILALSVLFFLLASYATLFHLLIPTSPSSVSWQSTNELPSKRTLISERQLATVCARGR